MYIYKEVAIAILSQRFDFPPFLYYDFLENVTVRIEIRCFRPSKSIFFNESLEFFFVFPYDETKDRRKEKKRGSGTGMQT